MTNVRVDFFVYPKWIFLFGRNLGVVRPEGGTSRDLARGVQCTFRGGLRTTLVVTPFPGVSAVFTFLEVLGGVVYVLSRKTVTVTPSRSGTTKLVRSTFLCGMKYYFRPSHIKKHLGVTCATVRMVQKCKPFPQHVERCTSTVEHL